MRNNLTHAEMIIHRDLWALAESQKKRQKYVARKIPLASFLKLNLKARREGWDELWPAPAFTRRLDSYQAPDWGICVAYRETQNSFGMEGLKKAIIHAEDEGQGIVGGWYFGGDGRFYFDSVRIYPTLAAAVPVARINGQIGIYDLTRNVYIPIDKAAPLHTAITQAQTKAAAQRKLVL